MTMNDQEFADDVIRTMNSLTNKLDEHRDEDSQNEAMNAMGFDPLEMLDMFKPQLRQKVLKNPEGALEAMAVLHMATRDVMEKHAEDDPKELAARGLDDGGE